jgi:hypothetical protein
MSIRQSTITCLEHSVCLVWEESQLNDFFSRYPGWSALLRDGLAGHRLMRELSNASFLTNLQDEHAALLTTLFQSRSVPSNTVIFEEASSPRIASRSSSWCPDRPSCTNPCRVEDLTEAAHTMRI